MLSTLTKKIPSYCLIEIKILEVFSFYKLPTTSNNGEKEDGRGRKMRMKGGEIRASVIDYIRCIAAARRAARMSGAKDGRGSASSKKR